MAHTTSPLLRLAALLATAAMAAALLVQPSASAAPPADPTLAEAEAQVQAARAALKLARAENQDAKARRNLLRSRVERNTATRDASAARLATARQQLGVARERVRDARSRLRDTPRGQRREARAHLRQMRADSTARRIEKNDARDRYRAAKAAVERATNGLERATATFAQTRAAVREARDARDAAEQRYAELLEQLSAEVTVAVANIPNRVGARNFNRSLRTLAGSHPDFMILNEISKRSEQDLRNAARGYGAYRGGPKLTERGAGNQSINNAVLWRTDTYEVVAQGRIKVVDDDRGYHHKKRFIWDRFATWVTLRRIADGRITSVISTHMPTNPAKFPRQHGNPPLTRIQMYARGMDKLIALAAELGRQGRVLVGGDMNSHPHQGWWSAVDKMTGAGYGYTKDRGVMYLFHPAELGVQSSRQLRISSDHPALITTLQFG